ncbi:MAG: hypothetical protein KIG85_06320 [Thiopseudomonas sp.]|nr:hypothetical protein [Thiopseudomonas sp.]
MQRWLILCVALYCGLSQAQTVEPAVLKALQQAQAAQTAGDAGKAVRLLEGLSFEKGSYAELLVLRNLGYLAWQQNRLDAAIGFLQKAEKHKHIEAEDRQKDRLSLAQLTLAAGRPQQTVAYLEGQPHTDEILQLGIQAWYQQKRYDRALPLAEKYLARQSSVNRQWTELMVGLYHGSKNYAKAAQWQRRLLAMEPDNLQQWQRLASLQRLAGNDAAAFATLRTAYRKGLPMNAQELEQMLLLAAAADQPWQAARLMTQLIEQGRLSNDARRQETLAGLHWQARDRKTAIRLYSQLAGQGNKADHWLVLAQLAMQERDWELGARALDSALTAGASRTRVQSWRDWLESSKEAESMARGDLAVR